MTLKEFFTEHDSVALAFSGGVDSAFLLSQSIKYAQNTHAYFVKSQFQPDFELHDAKRLIRQLGADPNIMTVIDLNVLSDSAITQNDPRRCYYCKKKIFAAILSAAKADGYSTIIDGTNASDEVADRPGMQALSELHVYSPLRECSITKTQIREQSKSAGLFTHDKPAYACLATRIKTGTPITATLLHKAEKSESYLFSQGFTDFRVRLDTADGCTARLQIKDSEFCQLLEKKEQILSGLSPFFTTITLDLNGR